jgi:hypothetical protein
VPVKAIDRSLLTTDLFGCDSSDDHHTLQWPEDMSEFGDVVPGLEVSKLGPAAPRWLDIGNVSDPQIETDGPTLKQQAEVAPRIDRGFGRSISV